MTLRPGGPGIDVTPAIRPRPFRLSAAQPRSLANRNAAYPPTVGCPDASPNRIASARVAIIGIVSAVGIAATVAIRSVKAAQTQTQAKPQSRATKAAAAETATTEASATPSKGRRGGGAQ